MNYSSLDRLLRLHRNDDRVRRWSLAIAILKLAGNGVEVVEAAILRNAKGRVNAPIEMPYLRSQTGLSESQLALEHECFASALIVLLTSIDIMANLDRPEGAEEVSPEDFVRWAERYLTPSLPHNVTGEEVYSARCAVLHTLGVESRRTRSGSARPLGFIGAGASLDGKASVV